MAFRTNLATVDSSGVVIDRRAGRYIAPEETRAVEEVMAKIGDEVAKRYGVEVVYKSTVEHRGVLVLRGPVSHKVSDTDPHKVGMPVAKAAPLGNDREAALTAEVVNYITARFTEAAGGLEINKARAASGRPPHKRDIAQGRGLHARH